MKLKQMTVLFIVNGGLSGLIHTQFTGASGSATGRSDLDLSLAVRSDFAELCSWVCEWSKFHWLPTVQYYAVIVSVRLFCQVTHLVNFSGRSQSYAFHLVVILRHSTMLSCICVMPSLYLLILCVVKPCTLYSSAKVFTLFLALCSVAFLTTFLLHFFVCANLKVPCEIRYRKSPIGDSGWWVFCTVFDTVVLFVSLISSQSYTYFMNESLSKRQ